jgi:hypothetical protein
VVGAGRVAVERRVRAAEGVAHDEQEARRAQVDDAASSMARPACTMPRALGHLPGRKPVVSSMKITGML